MWRSTLLALAFLLLCPFAFSQSTTVSGQITDAGAQTWNNGTFTFTFVPSANNPVGPYTWTGGTLNTTITGSLSATGSYSVSIPSNSAISPVGSAWSVQFCPQASSPCFTVSSITITGGTQTVNATPPAILISLQTAVPPVLAYSTSEITGAAIGSQFYLLGSGTQVCSAVSGNNCTTWSSGNSGGVGPITTAWYASPNCTAGQSNCTFVNANTHWVCDATTTNTSNIVTAPDGNFLVTAKVGQKVWAVSATCNGGTGALAIVETTILSVDSATQIHTTANATANNTANATLVWGTLDTPTTGNCAGGTDNVKTAWNAAIAVGASLYLPTGGGAITTGGSGGIMVECSEFQSPTSATATNPSNLIGHINSYVIATPNFDFTSVPAGGTIGALGTFNPTSSNIPNVSILRDVAFMCGGYNNWGTGISTHPIIYGQRVVMTNVTGWGCGSTGITNGFLVAGPSTVVAGNFYNFGASSCSTSSTGQNQTVIFTGTGYCSGPVGLTISGVGSWVASYGQFYQSFGGQASVNLTSNNEVFNSYGDIIECENSNNTICVRNAGTGNRVLLDGTWVYSTTETAAAFGLVYNAATSSTAAKNATIQGAGGVLIGGAGVTGIFNDLEANSYSGGSVCASSSCTLVADGHSAKGACTGTATASSTLGLYPLAGSTTTCTSTTPNSAPIVIQGARVLQNLVVVAGTGGVNASSGVVTVLRNGSTTTITCTLGTGTSCVDSTHTVTAADGDLISIQFTTQAADTLANVKAIVEWN